MQEFDSLLKSHMSELLKMPFTHHIHLGPLNSTGIEDLIKHTFKEIMKPGDTISQELIEEVQSQSQGTYFWWRCFIFNNFCN